MNLDESKLMRMFSIYLKSLGLEDGSYRFTIGIVQSENANSFYYVAPKLVKTTEEITYEGLAGHDNQHE